MLASIKCFGKLTISLLLLTLYEWFWYQKNVLALTKQLFALLPLLREKEVSQIRDQPGTNRISSVEITHFYFQMNLVSVPHRHRQLCKYYHDRCLNYLVHVKSEVKKYLRITNISYFHTRRMFSTLAYQTNERQFGRYLIKEIQA